MKKTEKKAGAFSKTVITAILVFLLLFIIAVLAVFAITNGSEPSTLVVSVFSFCGFECGIMGWIKSVKEKKDAKAEAEELKNKSEEQELE